MALLCVPTGALMMYGSFIEARPHKSCYLVLCSAVGLCFALCVFPSSSSLDALQRCGHRENQGLHVGLRWREPTGLERDDSADKRLRGGKRSVSKTCIEVKREIKCGTYSSFYLAIVNMCFWIERARALMQEQSFSDRPTFEKLTFEGAAVDEQRRRDSRCTLQAQFMRPLRRADDWARYQAARSSPE